MGKEDVLINKIIDIEWEMFQKVKAIQGEGCQEKPKTFRLMRWVSFSTLPKTVLASYLEDLQEGLNNDRNFMVEKYARIDNLVPQINDSPLINKIVEIEINWLNTLTEKYPSLLRNKNSKDFIKYLASELETYSDHTIELYYIVTEEAFNQGWNLIEERYNNLFMKLGYNSIEEGVAKYS